MPLWHAVVLGVVQGLTEFLPISSTAHLLVARQLLGHGDPEDAFTVVIQLGTLVAVVAYFRADLLRAMREQGWPAGRVGITHRWKYASILAEAYRHGVPATVHPGIGYDIISNHPVFSGSALGRGAEWDFKLFGGSADGLWVWTERGAPDGVSARR